MMHHIIHATIAASGAVVFLGVLGIVFDIGKSIRASTFVLVCGVSCLGTWMAVFALGLAVLP